MKQYLNNEDQQECDRNQEMKSTEYQLIGCIKHDGTVSDGHYSCYIKNRSSNEWYLMDDDKVKSEVFTMIKVSCVSVLIYERIEK